MSPKKKVDEVITKWHLRVCRRCFLHLEKQKITKSQLFHHGKLISKVDQFCLHYLATTLGCSAEKVINGPSLSAFLTDVKEILHLLRNK